MSFFKIPVEFLKFLNGSHFKQKPVWGHLRNTKTYFYIGKNR